MPEDQNTGAGAGRSFSPADPLRPPAADLITATTAELEGLYGPLRGCPSVDPAELAPPDGLYLVGRAGEIAVAGGGFRPLSVGVAEIKRMYVLPDHRGRGWAGDLLAALEEAALGLGYTVARLDTGPLQPHAQRLYEQAGYRSIADYNGNPRASFWGEKTLGTTVLP